MTTTRNLGTISTALLQAGTIDDPYFVKFTNSVIGTKYFTNRPQDYTGDIDGTGSHVWLAADVIVGPLDQSAQDPLTVSWVSFANLDYTWTNWVNTAGANSLRESAVEIWRAWFDAAGAFAGSYQEYLGAIDNGEYGDRAVIALKPGKAPWARVVPWAIPSPLCIHQFRDALSCQYAGADATCDKTRTACIAKANQARFGGADMMPKVGETIYWAGIVRG